MFLFSDMIYSTFFLLWLIQNYKKIIFSTHQIRRQYQLFLGVKLLHQVKNRVFLSSGKFEVWRTRGINRQERRCYSACPGCSSGPASSLHSTSVIAVYLLVSSSFLSLLPPFLYDISHNSPFFLDLQLVSYHFFFYFVKIKIKI